MVDMLPRRHLRQNHLSVDTSGQMWQYVPPNLVKYTPGDGDGENGDRLEPPVQPPIQSRVEATPPVREPPPRRREPEPEPEPERHRRRR